MIAKHGLNPYEFGGSGDKSAIFKFSAGVGDCPLFERGPEDEIGAKKYVEPMCGFSIIWTTRIVSIGEGL